MQLASDTIARTDAMVAACGLDSSSIFFCDRAGPAPRLAYLHHNGVSAEAQYIYEHDRVFEEDPFTSGFEGDGRGGGMIRWDATGVAGAASRAVNYWSFLDHYSVDVVGAFVQQVLPQLFLVLGAHCRSGGHRRSGVPLGLLESEIGAIARMVVAQLLEESLASGGGRRVVDTILAPVTPIEPSAVPLSKRERQIADLVGAGAQNKQVAFAIGLSEFTVENHLRRIYRKLGVRNRAGMATMLSRRTAAA